jgi:hypothetical protein
MDKSLGSGPAVVEPDRQSFQRSLLKKECPMLFLLRRVLYERGPGFQRSGADAFRIGRQPTPCFFSSTFQFATKALRPFGSAQSKTIPVRFLYYDY